MVATFISLSSIACDMAHDLIDDVAAYLFEAEFVSAGLARVVNKFSTNLINANARPDVLVPTRGTLDGPQPGRWSKTVSRGGPRQPRRCSKIASRLSDSLDRPNIRLVFIDVMGDGHCSSPKLGLVLNSALAYFRSVQVALRSSSMPRFTCALS